MYIDALGFMISLGLTVGLKQLTDVALQASPISASQDNTGWIGIAWPGIRAQMVRW